ncbi:MAG: hypothetical protein WBQ31_19235, partial [Candidatus Acidiferrales bacterium]
MFARLGSLVVAPALAVLATSEDELKVTAVVLIVMIARAPTPSDPKLQLTVPPLWLHVPCEVETETNETALGNGSETETPCATAGPL